MHPQQWGSTAFTRDTVYMCACCDTQLAALPCPALSPVSRQQVRNSLTDNPSPSPCALLFSSLHFNDINISQTPQ